MTTVTGRDYLAQQAYYQDQVRAATAYRQARRALAGRDRGQSVALKVLTWVGQRLVDWGTSLQEQYETVVSSASQSTTPAVGR